MTSIRPSPISARRLALGRAGARLANHYGPTEATIFATEWSCTLGDVGPVPIGRPVAGVRAYVLSDRLEPLPAGVAGELYLGGAGVAQGYVGAPGLTASAFLPDPFCEVAGARMYRTGDLARRREDGALDFLGRADDQVQLRGYRIELGEIEAVLLGHPAVRAAAVTQRPGRTGEPLLAAYVEGDGPVTADQLRAHLACHLPDYMLPGQLQLLDSMPRTVTGKVDRSRLPERASRIVAVPPRDAREQAVAAIWAHVLGLTDIAAFDVVGGGPGGSTLASLTAMRGHSTLLLEKALFPRYQIGESLLPSTVQGICRLIGASDALAEAGFTRKRGGTFRWGANQEPWSFSFSVSPKVAGPTSFAYQVERMKFDQILLDNARESGAKVRQDCTVTGVLDDADRVRGVRYADSAGRQHDVRAGYVVDASGHGSRIYQHVGGTRQYSQFFRSLALFGYFRGGKRLPEPNAGNILSAAFPGGWFWYIPLSPVLTTWRPTARCWPPVPSTVSSPAWSMSQRRSRNSRNSRPGTGASTASSTNS